MIEKMQKENDREVKKRESALKEKESAFEKLRVYQEVYEQLKIDDPGKFREDFESMQEELVRLNRQLSEKAKQMQSKEQKFKLREDELKTQKRKVRICLNEMADWTVNHLNIEALASSNEKSTHLEFELPDKKNKLEASCSALRDQLVKARQQLAAKTIKLVQKQNTLNHEMKESGKLKQEIVRDFKML